jgi:hypothetical protein
MQASKPGDVLTLTNASINCYMPGHNDQMTQRSNRFSIPAALRYRRSSGMEWRLQRYLRQRRTAALPKFTMGN